MGEGGVVVGGEEDGGGVGGVAFEESQGAALRWWRGGGFRGGKVRFAAFVLGCGGRGGWEERGWSGRCVGFRGAPHTDGVVCRGGDDALAWCVDGE